MMKLNDPVDRAQHRVATLSALFDGRRLSEEEEYGALLAISGLPVDLIEGALRGHSPAPVAAVLHSAIREASGGLAGEARIALRVVQALDAAWGALQDEKAREQLLERKDLFGRKHVLELLRLLSESGVPLKRSDVARKYEERTHQKLDPSRFGQLLEELGDAGFVLRMERSAQGGRAIWYSISPIGREALASRTATVESGPHTVAPLPELGVSPVGREALTSRRPKDDARARPGPPAPGFRPNSAAKARIVNSPRSSAVPR